jgi:hypothetical protein
MSLRSRLFLAFAVGVLTLGPALSLPRLSAFSPVLSAPAAPGSHVPGAPSVWQLAPLTLGTIKVKDVTTAAKKFKDRASAASTDYANGVQGAGADWEAKSAAAEDLYKNAVVDAAAKGRYGAGVRGSGAKYTKNATQLGPQRYQTGIANAQDAYAQAMGPVLQTIAGLNLPPRQLPGMNAERSNIVATALRKMKVGS